MNSIEQNMEPEKQVLEYRSIHTGRISIAVEHGQQVNAGDLLYTIERNGLATPIKADKNGIISVISKSDGAFVGFDFPLLSLEHLLSKEEKRILREEREYTFICSENDASHYLTPERGAPQLVRVGSIIKEGDVIAVSMVMKNKREIVYHGSDAEIKKIYFENEEQKKKGERLFGIVPL